MSANSTLIVNPDLSYREFQNTEFYDVTCRMVEVLTDPLNGLPDTDETNHEFVEDAGVALKGLGRRMGLDPKGKFTADKQAADRTRRTYASALTRGVRHILNDPLEDRSGKRREAAERLRRIFGLHLKGFSRQNSVQRSTALRLLFPACEPDSVKEDLQTTGLFDHFNTLQAGHDKYVELLRKEGLSETDPDPTEDAKAESIPSGKAAASAEAVDGAETVEGEEPDARLESSRFYKAAAGEALNLTFTIMARHARKGREPYARLLARCGEIIDSVVVLNKSRETRSKNAKAKKVLTENAEAQESTGAAPSPAPRKQAPVTVNDGLSS